MNCIFSQPYALTSAGYFQTYENKHLKKGVVVGGLVAQLCLTFATPWTVARQASLSMGLSRQEIWSRLPFPSPENHPDAEIEPGSPELQADSLPFELQESPNSFLLNIFFPQSSLLFTDFKRVSIL